MNNGWIKLHRQILENEFLQHDNNAYLLFTKLLLLANKKNGRYITGRHRLAEITNMNPSTVRDTLARLCKEGLADTEPDSKKTVITICKWKHYQQTNDRVDDSQTTARRQPDDTKQELRIKNKEIVSKDTMAKPVYGDPNINALFDYWELTVGYALISNKQKNRNACNNLLKRIGEDKVKQLIDGVAMSQEDRYAPRIADFAQLQLKLNDLLEWGKRRNKSYAKAEF